MIKLAPSLLAADPLHLQDAALLVKKTGCDEMHYDVMDGHFVPNLSFGPHTLAEMKKNVDLFYDVHLMVSDALIMVDPFADAGASLITVHQEAARFEKALAQIRRRGCRVGASIKPHTSAETLRPYLDQIDRVLLMTVEPGFGGQKLMPEVLRKAGELRAMGFTGDIEADGGISAANAAQLAQAGINVLVMGTGFFKAEHPEQVVHMVHGL